MAFNTFTADIIYQSMLGKMREAKGNFVPSQLYTWAKDKYSSVSGYTSSALRAIAVQVHDAYQIAQQMQNAPGQTVAGKDLPINPAIASGDPKYRYEVVVVLKSTDGQNEYSVRIDINSDTPLNAEQISESAIAQAERRSTARVDSGEGRLRRGQQFSAEAYLVSAGRRR